MQLKIGTKVKFKCDIVNFARKGDYGKIHSKARRLSDYDVNVIHCNFPHAYFAVKENEIESCEPDLSQQNKYAQSYSEFKVNGKTHWIMRKTK